MTWFDDLHQRVADEGQRPHILQAGEKGRLLVTEHGARILACELPGVDHNLFFDTSKLTSMKVTGGDRLWIAPETAYFWPTLEDARRDPKNTAACPESIDPIDYNGIADAQGVMLNLPGETSTLLDHRIEQSASISWDRHVSLSVSPLVDRPSITAFSYVIEHTLLGPEDAPALIAGTWDILQVPVGGTLICPTTINVSTSDRYTAGEQSHCKTLNAGPRSYYDSFGDQHVQVEDDCVRFLIDGKRRTKMGILPEHTTGRMGYYRSLGDGQSSLIFRSFGVFPGEPYCDLPINHAAHDAVAEGKDHPEMFRGDALQAYNDDGDAFPGTSFGEMEYHDPCVIAKHGPMSRTGSCVTHVMAGPDEAIKLAGQELLGVSIRGIG